MSRVGKKVIKVPAGVTVTLENSVIAVKGPKGSLNVNLPQFINFDLTDGIISLTRDNDQKHTRENHGTTRALLNNAIIGVSEGFVKKLEIVGIGYKAAMNGEKIVLSLGYSHDITLAPLNKDVTIEVPDATHVIVKGINKEDVGQMAALIREQRKPEPYGGKGVKYAGEVIIRKEGKRAGAK